MKQLFCANIFVPIRTGPSHQSEMGSQLLFGERYTIIDRVSNWLKIENHFDKYRGWIDNDHHEAFNNDEVSGERNILSNRCCFELNNKSTVCLEPGSEIYSLNKSTNSFHIGDISFKAINPIHIAPMSGTIVNTARSFLNCPYLWGGRLESGMDCSGLTQLVYKLHSYNIPRDSFEQAKEGETVNLLNEAGPGDLLFFDNEESIISHVGLLLDTNHIIHCSGKVRIDRIDHQGIFREDISEYTHKLRTIKRIITN